MLKEKIHQNLNTAIKEKNEISLLVLRQLLSAIFNKEKEKRYKLSKEKPELKVEELEKENDQLKNTSANQETDKGESSAQIHSELTELRKEYAELEAKYLELKFK